MVPLGLTQIAFVFSQPAVVGDWRTLCLAATVNWCVQGGSRLSCHGSRIIKLRSESFVGLCYCTEIPQNARAAAMLAGTGN